MRSAARLLVLGVVLGGCRIESTTTAAPAIAIASTGDRLYLAADDELGFVDPGSSRVALAGPCGRYLDLETWSGRLFALCDDGGVFEADEPAAGKLVLDEDWTALAKVSAVALQRSDGMLLAVAADGSMSELAAIEVVSSDALAEFDRFVGPERGGPSQLPIATFGPHAAAHALALERGPAIAAVWRDGVVSCSIPSRGANVGDLAVGEFAVAASIVDHRGRAFVVRLGMQPGQRPSRAAIDPSGRGRALAIHCRRR